MCPGLSTDLTNIDDVRKTTVIDVELNRLNIDIAGLQESRLAEEGSLREKNYTFFWKDRGQAEKREHGVGFAVENSLLGMIEIPAGGNESLLSLRLATSCGFATIITAYAPTLDSSRKYNIGRMDENGQRLLEHCIRGFQMLLYVAEAWCWGERPTLLKYLNGS